MMTAIDLDALETPCSTSSTGTTKGRQMTEIPTCAVCGRERTINDAYDYNPLQIITGKPLGWYSGDDGEFCPECFTDMMRKANGR